MSATTLLRVDGEVERPRQLSWEDFRALDERYQVPDVRQQGFKWAGAAVRLVGLLELVGAKPTVQYLGLHSAHDDFHASVPLQPVRDRALVIYERDGGPLDTSSGGPLRLFIPDHAACHLDEIDECANVKFLDHLELTLTKGRDNRPQDDEEHRRLHEK